MTPLVFAKQNHPSAQADLCRVEAAASAQINIFGVSTFDTDYLLVKEESLFGAAEVLIQSGFKISNLG